MNRYQSLLDTQREFFFTGQTRSAAWRLRQLDQMARLLRDNQQALCEALFADFRKPPFEQLFEITVPLGVLDYYRQHLDELMAPQPVAIPTGLEASGNRGRIYKEPYGNVLVIGPFNAPILLLLDPAIAALAAGNTVILKPANTTPRVARLLAELVPRYFEPEAVTVVTGGREEISALLELNFDFIFFTGSSAVGKVVMRAAAEHLTPVILELGGQNPTIVDETANLDIAVDRIAWGHNAISGQWCIAPGYVYVHASIAEDFIARLKRSLTAMYGEDPQRSPDLARMISEHDAERVGSYILPNKVVHGGRVDVADRYVEPTVLYPSSWDDPALQQEVFGPVLPVLPYDELQTVIAYINARPRPLALYWFGQDEAARDRVLQGTVSGGVTVNDTLMHIAHDGLPFGGVGESGLGAYHGETGFLRFTHEKAVFVQSRFGRGDLLYPPFGARFDRVMGLIRRLLR